jgi:hypothetical protein
MRKMLMVAAAVVTGIMGNAQPASADHRHRVHRSPVVHHHYHRHHRPRVVHHHHHHFYQRQVPMVPLMYDFLPPPPRYLPEPIYVPTCHPVLAGYRWNGYQQYPVYRQLCR